MHAAYAGLSQLFGVAYTASLKARVFRDSAAKERRVNAQRKTRGLPDVPPGAFNTIDLVFTLLKADGKAGLPIVFRYTGTGWSPSVEAHLRSLIAGGVPAWYFFGASVNEGHHSLVIAIDATGSAPMLFWMDQFSEGFGRRSSRFATTSNDVTGSLDDALKSVGTGDTRMWPLRSSQ